jgi:hypothetical protein
LTTNGGTTQSSGKNFVRAHLHTRSAISCTLSRSGRERKLVNKTVAQSKEGTSSSSHEVSPEELRQALEKVKTEQVPATQAQTEEYFMGQVNMGEQLSQQG